MVSHMSLAGVHAVSKQGCNIKADNFTQLEKGLGGSRNNYYGMFI